MVFAVVLKRTDNRIEKLVKKEEHRVESYLFCYLDEVTLTRITSNLFIVRYNYYVVELIG